MSQSSPHELYRHRQFGTVITCGLLVGLLVSLLAGQAAGWPLLLLATVGFMAVLLVVFHSLTTVVTPKHLQVAFGPGWVSKTISLNDIRSATPERSNLLWGWGIRYWPGRGWMWNVAGFDIVVLELPDGRQFRVGTNDPEGLAATIRQARDSRR